MPDFAHIHPTDLLHSLLLVLAALVILGLGKWVDGLLHPGIDSQSELVDKDNLAYALRQLGLWVALVIVLGSALDGPSSGLEFDLLDLGLWGGLGIVLLQLSLWINNKLILHTFDNRKEVIEDQNAGTGVVEAGSAIAGALVIFGAVSGQGGGVHTALAFWLVGQVVLVLAARVYTATLDYDLHAEIEHKDNAAAGIAYAGMLVATGNLVRIGTQGDYDGASIALADFLVYTLAALLLVPLLRWLADRILLPGRKISEEIAHQEKPNPGAGLIEAFAYIGCTVLIGWAV